VRRASSANNSRSTSAWRSALPIGTNSMPPFAMSGSAPQRVATTVAPHAIASTGGSAKPS
jgi:hypothetical protein